MNATTEQEIFTLKGDEAIALWLQGRDAWNQWVQDNPKAHVDFSGVDFAPYRAEDKRPQGMEEYMWPFAGFHFPDGDVDFSYAKFGDGSVNFDKAQFGDGQVSFSHTKFDDGDVDFNKAQFGNGNVNFYRTQFGDGDVTFNNAQFGDGNVSFASAQFGDGVVNFEGAHFSDGQVNFNLAQFGDGFVNFRKAKFGYGAVSFTSAQFGKGDVIFWEAQFGNVIVSFAYAQFGIGRVIFHSVNFGSGRLDFSRTICQGMVLFEELQRVSEMKGLSFQYAAFEGGLVLSTKGKQVFRCVPDLRGTKYNHQITLDKIHCSPPIDWVKFFLGKYKDPEDAARLCRLKEISEQNKDHDSALRFKAQELQAARHHTNTHSFSLMLESCFRGFSDYGRSILRPLISLVVLWVFWGGLYSFNGAISSAWTFSARQMFPLITVFRDQDFSDIYEKLDGFYSFLAFTQSILSLILLFLLGLALRNQFRL